ncbi:MAG: hypothetical protein LBB64_07650, partial [Dysgonamonadaceae bacterium]|nr:hypothetical protein [Dysgonamonadaceae bacterium]
VDNITVSGTGDICRFLNPDYRLPTSAEFEGTWSADNNNSPNDTPNPEGTAKIYSKSRSLNDIIFPASGYRYNVTGALNLFRSSGTYWSGSSLSSADAYQLFLNSKEVRPADTAPRAEGDPVRCVKN